MLRLNSIKANSFKEFTSNINPTKPLQHNFNFIKRFKNRFYQPKSNTLETNLAEGNIELQKAFEKIASSYDYGNSLPEISLNNDSNSWLIGDISVEEICSAIKYSKKNSAPGDDGISYFVYKNLPKDILIWLKGFFNEIFYSGKYPTQWKTFNVCFIPKGGNKGYRPIALASTLLKILERILNDRLSWWCESSGILSRFFNGFRRGRSCSDCLSTLHLDAIISREREELLGVLGLDFEGAYDKVNLKVLLETLENLNVPGRFRMFIKNLINNRILVGYFNGNAFASSVTNKGLPQGSILSPILFNIYIHCIPQLLGPSVKCLGFADDIAIYARGENTEEIQIILEEAIEKLDNWMANRDLNLSIPKCTLTFLGFEASKIRDNSVRIAINDQYIGNSYFFKYLGIIWDSALDWSLQIKSLASTVRCGINMLASICKNRWGIHPLTAIQFYKAIVRPKLDWGCFLFAGANSRLLKKLDVLQNSGLRLALGCCKTTPLNVLHHISGVPTLRIRREFIADRLIYNRFASTSTSVIPKLRYLKEFCKKLFNKSRVGRYGILFDSFLARQRDLKQIIRNRILPTFSCPYNSLFIEEYINVEWGFKIRKPQQDIDMLINDKFKESLVLFCDGSISNTKKRGAGVYMLKDQVSISFRLPSKFSILSCESFALLQALILPSNENFRSIVIFTDSLTALQNLKTVGLNSKMSDFSSKCRSRIWELHTKGISVDLYWIPGHSGIFGNNQADQAAKEGCIKTQLDFHNIIYTDLLFDLKRGVVSNMNEYVLRYGKGRKGRRYVGHAGDFQFFPWFRGRELSRRAIVILNRLRSGHSRARAHLASKNFQVDENCECGEDIHSVEHIIWDCPSFTDGRVGLIRNLNKKNVTRHSDITKICFDNINAGILISDFIMEYNIPI